MTSNDESILAFESFHLRESIWEKVESLTRFGSERNQIKKIIGESVIDETLDLHQEVQTLYEIWKDYHLTITQKTYHPVLPEPPLLRENLEKQITLLVKLLQQKVKKQGGKSITAVLNEDERSMIKSVSKGSKVMVAKQSPPDNTKINDVDSRCSSSLSVDVDLLKDRMNLMDIDEIIQPLRNDFEDERRFLLKDIEAIQNAMILEETNNQLVTHAQNSPTIKDLRTIESKLEKEVLSKEKASISGVLLSHESTSSSENSKSQSKKFSPSPPSSANVRNDENKVSNRNRKLVAARTFTYPDSSNNKHSPSPPLVGKLVTRSPIKKPLEKYEIL